MQNLLCELYLFNLFLQEEARWIPNHYVGEIYIRDLSYLMSHQIKWKEDWDFYGTVDASSSLIIRDEHLIHAMVIQDHQIYLFDLERRN